MQLIFYKAVNGTIYDKSIAFYTRGKYSHCEILFSDGVCFSASPRDGGTRFKVIEVESHWDRIAVGTSHEDEVWQWCARQVGKPYDWLGILGLSLNYRNSDKKKWYCSEVCVTALRRVGLLDVRPNLSPNALYRRIMSRKSF